MFMPSQMAVTSPASTARSTVWNPGRLFRPFLGEVG
jgi:hypothetical protein